MLRTPLKNLHVPLPEPLYRRLRTEAERAQRPATDLAREAIDRWLSEQQRQLLHDAIQTYARDMAGTRDDLDGEMESSAIECLIGTEDVEEPGK
jgi:hypothetical protein